MGNPRGQVSIFLIFIFHILFLFFAMVINVGMLVHHKINLQNSVDLAAYYGAMKQSEILGAIAHSNYQIRQSWKLMNFRYHILGGLGRETHPTINSITPRGNVRPQNASVFCMAADYIYQTRELDNLPLTNDQTICSKDSEVMRIDGMKVPDFVGSIAIHQNISEQIRHARDIADYDFKDRGVVNFRLLVLFVALNRVDAKNRKLIINQLADLMSKRDDDFTDLDGNSAYEGANNTFKNNLTVDNQASQFRFYNSMGNKICGKKNDIRYPPRWLKQITVLPQYIYYDNFTDANAVEGRYNGGFSLLEKLPIEFDNVITDNNKKLLYKGLQELAHPEQSEDLNLFDLVGVEKDPWCLTYTGASAIAQPNLPFMPASIKIPIIASSYAKAFGGKIGPWYESQWSRGSEFSKGGQKIDLTLPIRWEDKATVNSGVPKDYKARMPNFARYPGDDVGIISLQDQFSYGKMILDLRTQLGGRHVYDTFSWISKTENIMQTISNLYTGLPYMPMNHDILAEPKNIQTNQAFLGGHELRVFEQIAVAPDLFDITYYSIEPNYWSLYLMRRLRNLFPDYYPRGDLGSTIISPFTIFDQMKVVGNNPYNLDISQMGAFHKIYKQNPDDANDPAYGRLLTNWTEKSLQDYSIEKVKPRMFGKCPEPIPQNLQGSDPTQGECLRGGRTGYSVKLVSRKFLERQDLPLGGFGTSGSILNPPPPTFEF
jgi:hypothetical protein